jgi:hypothetical protein
MQLIASRPETPERPASRSQRGARGAVCGARARAGSRSPATIGANHPGRIIAVHPRQGGCAGFASLLDGGQRGPQRGEVWRPHARPIAHRCPPGAGLDGADAPVRVLLPDPGRPAGRFKPAMCKRLSHNSSKSFVKLGIRLISLTIRSSDPDIRSCFGRRCGVDIESCRAMRQPRKGREIT